MGHVHEDPDELGYFTRPLGRLEAQEDLGAVFEPGGAENGRTGPPRPILDDVLPWEDQMGIAQAATHWAEGNYTKAEDFRNAVGYSCYIDPNDP
jgi:hypothetical protein